MLLAFSLPIGLNFFSPESVAFNKLKTPLSTLNVNFSSMLQALDLQKSYAYKSCWKDV